MPPFESGIHFMHSVWKRILRHILQFRRPELLCPGPFAKAEKPACALHIERVELIEFDIHDLPLKEFLLALQT